MRGGSLNQQKYFCPKLKYEGHLKKSGLLPKKKKNCSFQDVTLHLNLEDRFRLFRNFQIWHDILENKFQYLNVNTSKRARFDCFVYDFHGIYC